MISRVLGWIVFLWGVMAAMDRRTCVIIPIHRYGRSGNMQRQFEHVVQVLERCSGVAYHRYQQVWDPIAGIPQLMGTLDAWSADAMLETLPEVAHQCHHFHSMGPRGMYLDQVDRFVKERGCSTTPRYAVSSPSHWNNRTGAPVDMILAFDVHGWMAKVPDTTVAMHFRGGDTMRGADDRFYIQPICDYYLTAYRLLQGSCAILVAEDDTNPCTQVLLNALPCVEMAPCTGSPNPGLCSMTVLARARRLVTSKSTFSIFAYHMLLSDLRPKHITYPISLLPGEVQEPVGAERDVEMERYGHAIAYSIEGLYPWMRTEAQIQLLKNRTVSLP